MQDTGVPSRIERLSSATRPRFAYLIAAALTLHLALAIGIHIIGRFALLPETFDANGIGITFAVDSASYRNDAIGLTDHLFHEGFAKWLAVPAPFHVHLYSLLFAILGPWVGFNTLAAEPLNVLYYLLILVLTFQLGREAFDRRVGLIAAGFVALWPSFLLHTTQLLRDPLFIAAMLTLVLLNSTWLTRVYSWGRGLVAGTVGGIACLTLWLIRGDMWEVIVAIVFLGIGFLILRQLAERQALPGNMLGATVLLVTVLTVPRIVESYRQSDSSLVQFTKRAEIAEGAAPTTAPSSAPQALAVATPSIWSRLPARIGLLRKGFVLTYPEAGSNVDTNVELTSTKDIVYYLPRAAIIGFFSPFPNMWFTAGVQVGFAGRLLSGLETLVIYAFGFFAVIGLWRARSLSAWLLLLVAALGSTALGLVVVNISTLYRMRYSFWILLVILGVAGAVQLFGQVACREEDSD
ncbi:MAG: hypothetical protein ACR2HX_01845 [Pyrinomonadaceae bacterium]